MAEETRVRVRQCRREAMDESKKAEKGGEITEDDLKGIEKEIQTLTDKFVKKIDETVTKKEAEIMTV
jgi:ribosome recycling factor